MLHYVKDLGNRMITRYKEDEAFRSLIRSTLALPLLPPDLIEPTWERLKSELLELEDVDLIKVC